MPIPKLRFSIRSLMIAVVVVAGVLALPGGIREFVALLILPCLAVVAAQWLFKHGERTGVGIGFWGLAIVVNVGYTLVSTQPKGYLGVFLCVIWFFFLLPTMAAFGTAWAILTRKDDRTGDRLVARAAWPSVILLTLLPPVMAGTLLPFRIAFALSKPTLERLADRAASGRAFGPTRLVGAFLLAGSEVDPASGNVALLIDPDPNGPSGFVRCRRTSPYGCHLPIRGDRFHLPLDDEWCYHEED